MDEDRSLLADQPSPIEDRCIRVVLFGGGPVLERGVKQFICRLEELSVGVRKIMKHFVVRASLFDDSESYHPATH